MKGLLQIGFHDELDSIRKKEYSEWDISDKNKRSGLNEIQ